MRYAFVSDIHANLQAWEAVLHDLVGHDVDCLICLGDVVGYGPRPAEVLGAVAGTADFCLLGNHDAAVCGRMDASLFSGEAKRVVRWTADQLGRATQRLSPLPYSVAGEGFTAVHANASHPGSFEYLADEETARTSWSAFAETLLFVGHTHVPEIHALAADGVYACYLPGELHLEPGSRYIVNVGSVGLPRDDDPRASYCLFDDEAQTVFCRRVPFDVPGFLSDVKRVLGTSEQADYLVYQYRQAVASGAVAAPADEAGEAALREAVSPDAKRLRDDFAPDLTAPLPAPTVLRIPRVRRRAPLRAPKRRPAWHPYTPLPDAERDAGHTPKRRKRRRWLLAGGILLGLGVCLAGLGLARARRHTEAPPAEPAVRAPARPVKRTPADRKRAGFGNAFTPSDGPAVTLEAKGYSGVPVTVECWVRLDSHQAFNVLVACGRRTDAGHWQLYTAPGSGVFGVYRRGLKPSRVESDTPVCDGAWHYLAMVHEPGLIRLFVDGALVTTAQVTGRLPANRHALAVGSLLGGDYATAGAIDELRVSRALRALDSIPQRPLEADSRTVGLWRFDRRGSEGQFRDYSTGANPMLVKAPPAAAPKPTEGDGTALDDGLVGIWSLNELAQRRLRDSSGTGHHLEVRGDPKLFMSDGDRVRRGLHLDGRRDAIPIPAHLLDPEAGAVTGWLRLAEAKTQPQYFLGTAGGASRYCIVVAGDRVRAVAGERAEPFTEGRLQPGAWHHLALTWRSHGEATFFLDGERLGSRPVQQLYPAEEPAFGAAGDSLHLAGTLDDLRLYRRVLGPAEIKYLYQHPPLTPRPGAAATPPKARK